MKIAVIGSGISGLLGPAAGQRARSPRVRGQRLRGGHTNTVSFEAFGQQYAADTGFMVFNERTYPNFFRMLQMLGVRRATAT